MKITNIRRQAAAQSSGVPISEAAEAEDHGHPFARNLANNQSHTIGLLSDRITTDAFAGQLIRSALSTALLHNQLMLIGEGCLGCPNPCSIEQSSLGSRAGLSLGAICPYLARPNRSASSLVVDRMGDRRPAG